MSQMYEAGRRSFTVDAAYSRCIRVKLSATANQVTVAGVTDQEAGTLSAATFNAGDACDVILRTAQGTQQLVAAGAITVNSVVYTAASGKISSTQATGAIAIGVALTAASASGDIVEVLRYNH